MTYVGRPPQREGSYKKLDPFAFNGVLTTFPLTVDGSRPIVPGQAENLSVVINDVPLDPGVDYSVSASTITFVVAYAGAATHHALMYGDSYKSPESIPTDLNSLADVTSSGMSVDDCLKWNGSGWVNGPAGTTHINNLDGINTSAIPIAENHSLVYRSGEGGWINAPMHVDYIEGFTVTTPSTNDVLSYAGGQWVNIANNLSACSDVDDFLTTNATNNTILLYNGTNNQFELSDFSFENLGDSVADVDYGVSIATGDALIWDDTSNKGIGGWVAQSLGGGAPHALADHTNVLGTVPTVGQTLAWDGSNWAPADASGGAISLSDLTDVDASGASGGQVLTFIGLGWVPMTPASGGGASIEETINIYVSSSGNDTTGDGSELVPFKSITKCMAHIADKMCTKGINIIITAGDVIYDFDTITFDHRCPIHIKSSISNSLVYWEFGGDSTTIAYSHENTETAFILRNSHVSMTDLQIVKNDVNGEGGAYAYGLRNTFVFYGGILRMTNCFTSNFQSFCNMDELGWLDGLSLQSVSMQPAKFESGGRVSGSYLKNIKDLDVDVRIWGSGSSSQDQGLWYRIFHLESCTGKFAMHIDYFKSFHVNHRCVVLDRCNLDLFKFTSSSEALAPVGAEAPLVLMDLLDTRINRAIIEVGEHVDNAVYLRTKYSSILRGYFGWYNRFITAPIIHCELRSDVNFDSMQCQASPQFADRELMVAEKGSSIYVDNINNTNSLLTSPTYTYGHSGPNYGDNLSQVHINLIDSNLGGGSSAIESSSVGGGSSSSSGEGPPA